MRQSITIDFNENTDQYKSSVTAFAHTILGKKYTHTIVAKYFDILVDPDDYAKNERSLMVRQMCMITSWKSRKLEPEIERDLRLGNGLEEFLIK